MKLKPITIQHLKAVAEKNTSYILQHSVVINKYRGLCQIIAHCEPGEYYSKGGVWEATQDIFQKWPENSGRREYPISVDSVLDPVRQFDECTNMYDFTTEYGKARARLAAFILTQVEERMGGG